MPLEEYRRKRRFRKTPEPEGKVAARSGNRFVIQEHHATRFHHDFRLEMAGVLRSWAVPKGISLNPDDKRLAVAVEDHPLDYIDFEGTIPEGNYGAGAVMVWDRGTYESLEGDPAEGFKKGKLTVVLRGQKIQGEFHLVRTRMGGRGGGDDGSNWLLFKKRDDDAVAGWSLPKPSRSVKSGRTIDEIRKEEPARWHSSEPAPGPVATRARRPAALRRWRLDKPGSAPLPKSVPPMLAKLIEEPFDDPAWVFEPKWDGVRAIAILRGQGPERSVLLHSRNLHSMNRQYPEVVDALYGAGLPDAVLDGEVIAPDEFGRPSFQRLQQRINLQGVQDVDDARAKFPVLYFVFDILHYNGHDLTTRALRERREILEAILPPGPVVRLSDTFPGEGKAFYRAAQDHRLEGIVGKRAASPYEPGRRSGAWVKIKVRRTLQAVVGGFTQGRRGRSSHFGALIVGLYDGRGRLQHIGQVGGGFTDRALEEVLALLRPLVRKTSPFATTPATMEPATWIEPRIVVEVEYGEWTDEGVLRAPVYKGLRPDVPPHESLLEEVRPPQIPDELSPDGGPPRPASGTRSTATGRRGAETLSPLEREVAKRRLPVEFTNLEKTYWPELGLTKADLITYYLAISETILPHLRDRPLTLRRFPDGIHGENFHQKDYPDAPDYVTIAHVWTETTKTTNAAPVGNNLATLLWLAQIADIEMHPWYSRITPARRGEGAGELPGTDVSSSEEALRASVLNFPDQLVFDVDPYIFPKGQQPRKGPGEKDPDYSRRGFEAAREAAIDLRRLLEGMGLQTFVKTSGKTGLHLYVPIARRYTYDETHGFAKAICQFLAAEHSDRLTTEWAVEKRVGKVFLDYNQNRLGATLASAYSLRPTPQATVSTPVTWKELERGFDPLTFTYKTVPARLRKTADPWKDMGKLHQRLEQALATAGQKS
ncbi:MAG TPA: non-homologous end-joining DNA ligase [bacterium]|nr:non-homologous end-joining DNA ligase [bacterium]